MTLSVYSKLLTQSCVWLLLLLGVSVHGICLTTDAKSLSDQKWELTWGDVKVTKCSMMDNSRRKGPS